MSRKWVLLIPLLMAALNLAALFVQLRNPGDTSTPESLLVYCAQRVQHGLSLYQDYHRPPYNYMPYTPLYTWITGTMARGLSLDLEGLFYLGRAFTLACCFGIALLLYGNERAGAQSFLPAAAGASLFLASTILKQWAPTCRPDMLAVLFSLAGFLVYTRFADRPNRLISLVFFALAFLTKQSSLSAPAAIVLHQVMNKRYREAVLMTVGFVVPAVVLLVGMHAGTDGLSTLDIIENNAAPMQWLNIKLIGLLFLQASALPMILGLIGAGEKGKNHPDTGYLATSLLLAVVSSAKLGSNVNYYLEPLAVACLLVPAGIRFLVDVPKGSVVLAALIVVLCLPPLSFISYSLQHPEFRSDTNIRELAHEARGPVLTDSPRLALISQHQFLIDPFPFSYLEAQGKWDSKEPVAMLDRHQYPLVILTLPIENSSSWQGAKRLPQPMIDAVIRNYALKQTVDGYYVYLPR